jgi:hypothetical protein
MKRQAKLRSLSKKASQETSVKKKKKTFFFLKKKSNKYLAKVPNKISVLPDV